MSRLDTTYEVRVNVKKDGTDHFSTHVGKNICEEITQMFHVDAHSPQQACRKAERYGRPVSVRKANVDKLRGDAEQIKLGEQATYSYAMMLDEMVWMKRNKRIENEKKDHSLS